MEPHTYPEMARIEDSHFWFVGKRAFIQKALSLTSRKTPQILDIGCGTGGTTLLLTRYGTVHGLEQNPLAASFARKRGLTVTTGTANRLPFPDHSFDMVTFFDVLYHRGIREPQALREANRVLKRDGILLITDCAVPSLTGNHDLVMHAKYRYTQKQLTSFVLNAGFVIDKAGYIFASIFPFFALARLTTKYGPSPKKITTVPTVINRLFIALLTAEASLFPAVSMPFGSSLLILAHKV